MVTITIENEGGGTGMSGLVNATALRSALAHLPSEGGIVRFASAGTYELELADAIEMPANVTIEGCGQDVTTVQRTDTTTLPTFTHINGLGGIAFRGFTFFGNLKATTGDNGNFLLARLDENADKDMKTIKFADMAFTNIKADGWILFQYLHESTPGPIDYDIDGIFFEPGCTFISTSGSSRTPTSISGFSACISLIGPSQEASIGRIRNVVVDGAYFDIPHIKSMMVIWQGVEDVELVRTRCNHVGTEEIGADSGGYAVLIGNEEPGAPNPDRIRLDTVIVNNGKTAGVYGAAWGSVGGRYEVVDCTFENITTPSTYGLLPTGAIAFGDNGTEWYVRNLKADNVSYGIFAAQSMDCVLDVKGADISGLTANGAGILLAMHAHENDPLVNPVVASVPDWEGPARHCRIRDVQVTATASDTIGIRIAETGDLGHVYLSGDNRFLVKYSGIYGLCESQSTNLSGGFHIDGLLTIENATIPIVFRKNSSPLRFGGVISIARGTLSTSTARSYCINIDSCPDVRFSGQVQIDGLQSMDAFALSGATMTVATGGTLPMEVFRFTNMGAGAASVRADGWGAASPGNVGNAGDFVANLLSSASGGQKIDGWWWNDAVSPSGAWWVKRSDIAS